MLKNKKFLGTVLLLTVACGKSNNNRPNGLGGAELTIENPLPVNENLVTDKEVVDNVSNGADYSKKCSDEGVSCDGVWMLKQARCNDVPVSGSFEGEPVVMNIKGDRIELQFETDLIQTAEFGFDDVRSDLLVFKFDDGTVLKKNYTVAVNEGVMNIYPSGNDAKCASGYRKMIFTRLDSDKIVDMIVKASDKAIAKKAAELAPQQLVEEVPATDIVTEDTVSSAAE